MKSPLMGIFVKHGSLREPEQVASAQMAVEAQKDELRQVSIPVESWEGLFFLLQVGGFFCSQLGGLNKLLFVYLTFQFRLSIFCVFTHIFCLSMFNP